ncbi:diphthine synthase [Candidatus Bathyarchaeota archaeon]|nr:MAG: diphthine synthase [Candidatus Bathyarchaeota archaeon]
MGISLRGLEEVKTADSVFIELYTNLMPDFSVENLEKISGKKLHVVSRRELEEDNGKALMAAAEGGKVVLLVPGDPLVATTHVALRIHAEKLGINTRIIHGASIISAVIGLSGLHNYKFGKSVTIPFSQTSETPYEVIAQNRKFGLHTLCLLDVDVEKNRSMKIREGLESLLKTEEKRKEKIITMNTLAVGVARAGTNDPTIKAGFLKDLLDYDFGEPPHSIIFPSKLHFMEAEALIVLTGGPEQLREMIE